MSDSSTPEPECESSFETTFVSTPAVYTKGSGKEVKSVKVKEFDFTKEAVSESCQVMQYGSAKPIQMTHLLSQVDLCIHTCKYMDYELCHLYVWFCIQGSF